MKRIYSVLLTSLFLILIPYSLRSASLPDSLLTEEEMDDAQEATEDGPQGNDAIGIPYQDILMALLDGRPVRQQLRERRLNNAFLRKCLDALTVDGLRDMLEKKYPEIEIVDAPYFYDAGVFNKSERSGCILLTLDAWAGVHPSLVTIPAEWDYRVPYGLLYPKTPSRSVTAFLESLGL